MYRPYASCHDTPRAAAQANSNTTPFRTPEWQKRPISTASSEDYKRLSTDLRSSIVKRALRTRQATSDGVVRVGEDGVGRLLGFFDTGEEAPDYDVDLITGRRKLLKSAVVHEEAEDLLCFFRTLVTRNIGGISNPYVEAPDVHDRKHAFNRYKRTVLQATVSINELFDASTDRENRVRIFDCVCDTISEFGKSATLLSGGGTLGMYHIGVLKTFRGTNPRLISQVISGASAGSIVASVFASKKDDELDEAVQRLCYGDLDVFVGSEEQNQGYLERLRAAWRRRGLYDPKNLERVMKDLLGEKLTFKDAFNLTGKRLNITVSTSDGDKDDFRLLNYITSPEIVIWSAVVASCAVPFAFPSGQLWFRDTDMTLKKVDTPVGHMDGSIYGDVPMDRISREFNVNYFVVSQVNPHVVPFLDTNKTLQRWFPYAYYAAGKSLLKNTIVSALDPLQDSSLLGVPVFRAVGSIFHQRYEGDLTLFPVRLGRNLADVFNCMNNPTHAFMDRAVGSGEKEAERMLSKAHAVLDVEMMLQDLKMQLKTKLKFSKSEEDLHRREIQDRMLSGRSYSALSRRGGGHDASSKSVAHLPTDAAAARAHRTSQSLELGYMQLNTSAEKVAGSIYDSCASSSTSDSNDDDEEDHSDDEAVFDSPGLRIAVPSHDLQRFSSHPPSPIDTRRRSYFPPSRSSSRSSSRTRSPSPGDPLAGMSSTLRMTPRTPSTRSQSPVASRKGPRQRTESTSGEAGDGEGVLRSWRRRIPHSLRGLVDLQSGITRPMGFRMGKTFLRKRSLSAAGIDDWARELQVKDEVEREREMEKEKEQES